MAERSQQSPLDVDRQIGRQNSSSTNPATPAGFLVHYRYMERLPRVVPFWMMLLGIVGFFVLAILYFDVRGRETQSPAPPAPREIEDVQPVPESSDETNTPTIAEDEGVLRLPSEVPASDIPAVAAYECLRYESRDDRIIVDWTYRHISSLQPATLTTKTVHLDCTPQEYITLSKIGASYYFHAGGRNDPLDQYLTVGGLYRVDPFSGQTELIALTTRPPQSDLIIWKHRMSLSPDQKYIDIVWDPRDGIPSDKAPSYVSRVDLLSRKEQKIIAQNVYSPITLNPSHSYGIAIEWSCGKMMCDQYPAFLHRYNLSSGKSVRVGEVFDWNQNIDPIFIDDEHVVVAGEDTPAFVMNIYTRATEPIKKITATLDRLAITTDGKNIVVTGPNQPFTVIPVSELPKP